MEDRHSKKLQINVSKGFRSGLLFKRHFVLESIHFHKYFNEGSHNINKYVRDFPCEKN